MDSDNGWQQPKSRGRNRDGNRGGQGTIYQGRPAAAAAPAIQPMQPFPNQNLNGGQQQPHVHPPNQQFGQNQYPQHTQQRDSQPGGMGNPNPVGMVTYATAHLRGGAMQAPPTLHSMDTFPSFGNSRIPPITPWGPGPVLQTAPHLRNIRLQDQQQQPPSAAGPSSQQRQQPTPAASQPKVQQSQLLTPAANRAGGTNKRSSPSAADAAAPPRPPIQRRTEEDKEHREQSQQPHSVKRQQPTPAGGIQNKGAYSTRASNPSLNDQIRWTRHAARLVLSAYLELKYREGSVDGSGGSETEELNDLLRMGIDAMFCKDKKNEKKDGHYLPTGEHGEKLINGLGSKIIVQTARNNKSTAKDVFPRFTTQDATDQENSRQKKKRLLLLQRIFTHFFAAYMLFAHGDGGRRELTSINTQEKLICHFDELKKNTLNAIGLDDDNDLFPLPDGNTGILFTEAFKHRAKALRPS